MVFFLKILDGCGFYVIHTCVEWMWGGGQAGSEVRAMSVSAEVWTKAVYQ